MTNILGTVGVIVLFAIALTCLVESYRRLLPKNFERSQRAALHYFSLLACSSLCLTAVPVIAPKASLRWISVPFGVMTTAVIVIMYYVNKKLESRAAEAEQIAKIQQTGGEDE